MAERLIHVELRSIQDFRGLVEEVHATNVPRILTQDNEDVAVLMPAKATKGASRTKGGKGFSREDSLWNIAGIAHTTGTGDAARNHDKYLADAYAETHE